MPHRNVPASLRHINYVLAIEDDVDLRAALVLMLQVGGYKVIGVSNGVEAVKILTDPQRINHPGLILLDLEMPYFSGWDVLNVIAMAPALQKIPLVITTGNQSPRVSSGYEVLAKPYRTRLMT
jgi:CheY-like chemotaxis protein